MNKILAILILFSINSYIIAQTKISDYEIFIGEYVDIDNNIEYIVLRKFKASEDSIKYLVLNPNTLNSSIVFSNDIKRVSWEYLEDKYKQTTYIKLRKHANINKGALKNAGIQNINVDSSYIITTDLCPSPSKLDYYFYEDVYNEVSSLSLSKLLYEDNIQKRYAKLFRDISNNSIKINELKESIELYLELRFNSVNTINMNADKRSEYINDIGKEKIFKIVNKAKEKEKKGKKLKRRKLSIYNKILNFDSIDISNQFILNTCDSIISILNQEIVEIDQQNKFIEKNIHILDQDTIFTLPIGIAISGMWIKYHKEDLEWLLDMQNKQRLSITWINHSYNHEYIRGRNLKSNFLLIKDSDINKEVLKTEELMMEEELDISIYFRFPGLVSNEVLYSQIIDYGLIPLGADSWIGKQKFPKNGSIVLVHTNGNEPKGLRRFNRWLKINKEYLYIESINNMMIRYFQ